MKPLIKLLRKRQTNFKNLTRAKNGGIRLLHQHLGTWGSKSSLGYVARPCFKYKQIKDKQKTQDGQRYSGYDKHNVAEFFKMVLNNLHLYMNVLF